MASIARWGTGYQFQIRLYGYPPVSRMFDSPSDARVWARAAETDLRRGSYSDPRELMTQTIGELPAAD